MITMPRGCPCGAQLKSEADKAHGVCTYCRVDAKKVRRKVVRPDFVDEEIPGLGLQFWGKNDT